MSSKSSKSRRRLTGVEWLLGFPRPAAAPAGAGTAAPNRRSARSRGQKRGASPPHW